MLARILTFSESNIVASASITITQTAFKQGSGKTRTDTFVLPDLLRCLVVSWSDQPVQLLRSVAEDESWQAKVCSDVQDFLRSVFQLMSR